MEPTPAFFHDWGHIEWWRIHGEIRDDFGALRRGCDCVLSRFQSLAVHWPVNLAEIIAGHPSSVSGQARQLRRAPGRCIFLGCAGEQAWALSTARKGARNAAYSIGSLGRFRTMSFSVCAAGPRLPSAGGLRGYQGCYRCGQGRRGSSEGRRAVRDSGGDRVRPGWRRQESSKGNKIR